MRRYSAAEAIGPAWEHTTNLLWRDRNWKTGWKIALLAFLAEMGSFNFNLPGRNQAHIPPTVVALMAAFALAMGLVLLVIGLVLFYLASRLQLSLYDMIVSRQTLLTPAWRKYGTSVWRWIGLKILFFLGALLLAAPLLLMVFFRLRGAHGNQAMHGAHLLYTLLPIIFFLILYLLFVITMYLALRDFVLPSIALEDTPLTVALQRVRAFIAMEPAAILGFMGLRMVLGIVFGIVAYIATAIALAISTLPFLVAGVIVWLPLRHAGGPMHFLVYVWIGVLAALYAVWAIALAVALFGTLLVFYVAWGAYFLGGRYPMLGDMLEPAFGIAPPFTPPPSFPHRDDHNGPDLPMNPQPAS